MLGFGPLPIRSAGAHVANRRYTVNLFLPFALLLFKTRRPPLVAMRVRNPWVLFLFRLVGVVNVFFMSASR